jgi:hypothetical protein
VRKLHFKGLSPSSRFKLQPLRILKWDDDTLLTVNREDYVGEKKNYSSWPWFDNEWTIPFVTGHKYKIHWGQTGLDYDQMTIDASERWQETDKHLYFVHNFTQATAGMDVKLNNVIVKDKSIPAKVEDYKPG